MSSGSYVDYFISALRCNACQVVQDIDNCLTEFDCDRFDTNKPTLRSLQSGMIAPDLLVQDFEGAHAHGEKCLNTFLADRIECSA